MDRIDLHTHSTASDGSMTPSELVHHAASCGLRAVALTDHDTTVGLTEAQQAANEIGIELVHGVELATWLDKTEFHIVGLDIIAINHNTSRFCFHCCPFPGRCTCPADPDIPRQDHRKAE